MTDPAKDPAHNTAGDLSTDPPDLLQLLQGLEFEHWHSLLLDLPRRFDGWMADFLAQPESSPDYRPMADLLAVLRDFPLAQAGNDLALARAITDCDFFARAARDQYQGAIAWDPCAESYAAFSRRHAERYPYWDVGPAWPVGVLAQWLIGRLDARPA